MRFKEEFRPQCRVGEGSATTTWNTVRGMITVRLGVKYKRRIYRVWVAQDLYIGACRCDARQRAHIPPSTRQTRDPTTGNVELSKEHASHWNCHYGD